MVNQCINNNIPECDLPWYKRVKMNRPPRWQDVCNYFAGPKECYMNVIYMKKNSSAFSTIVKYKEFDTCVEYFNQLGRYYYVYISLLRNILVWSAHPKLSGLQGVIGHHISIGNIENGYFDIHETMYTIQKMHQYHIIAGKKKRLYTVDPATYHLRSMDAPPPHYAPKVWNQILRYTILQGDMEAQRGGMGHSDPRIIITNKNPRHHMDIDSLTNIITDRIAKVTADLVDEHNTAFIRIPYVPPSVQTRLTKRLDALVGSTSTIQSITLVSDFNVEYSTLMINGGEPGA